MIRSRDETENSIRDNFPILFRGAPSIADDIYLAKRAALTDYAISVTGPILSAETVRYQSLIMFSCLISALIGTLRLSTFNIISNQFAVDKNFIIIFELFLSLINILFLAKSYVDYQRSMIIRKKNDHVVYEIQQLNNIGILIKNIQHFFWLELFDSIGETYAYYSDAQAEAINNVKDFKHISMQGINLDLEALRKLPELKSMIEEKQQFVQEIKDALEADNRRFHTRANTALFKKKNRAQNAADTFEHETWTAIGEAFELCLKPWFDVRNKLVSEFYKEAIDDMGSSTEYTRAKSVLTDLKSIVRIRKIYFILEILIPLGLSILVAIFMHYRY